MKKFKKPIIYTVVIILKMLFDGFSAYNKGLRGEDIGERVFSGLVGIVLILVVIEIIIFIYKKINN